jgi:hypothetical protein
MKDKFGGLFSIIGKLSKAVPTKFLMTISGIWDMDHFAAMIGLCNENFL